MEMPSLELGGKVQVRDSNVRVMLKPWDRMTSECRWKRKVNPAWSPQGPPSGLEEGLAQGNWRGQKENDDSVVSEVGRRGGM